MKNKKKLICIIPARSGSKRISSKNIKNFHGKPLIYYAIKKALRSKIFNKIIVSTDSTKIAKISIEFGAEVPYLRPKNISKDNSSTLDVLKHSINKLNLRSDDEIFCLYPTTPLLEIKYIRKIKNKLNTYPKNICFTIIEADSRFQRGFFLNDKKITKFFNKGHLKLNTQHLQKSYVDAGQVYAGRVNKIKNISNLIAKENQFVIIDKNKVIDIDDKLDWLFAEFLFKTNKKNLIL